MVHLLPVLVNLLVPLAQLFVELFNLSFIVVELEELELNTGPGNFILKTLVTLSLKERSKDTNYMITTKLS